jgi:hypothetical protein
VPSFAPDDASACARAIHAALSESREVLEGRAERAARFSWDRSAAAWVEGWRVAVGRASRTL